jgi:hypothetical protein
MIITEFDGPLTAEDARKISINNREDSEDRVRFRALMADIKHSASFGYTRLCTSPECKNLSPAQWGRHPSEHVQNALRSFGFRVVEKKAYEYDAKLHGYCDRPMLNPDKREQFFLEITWG